MNRTMTRSEGTALRSSPGAPRYRPESGPPVRFVGRRPGGDPGPPSVVPSSSKAAPEPRGWSFGQDPSARGRRVVAGSGHTDRPAAGVPNSPELFSTIGDTVPARLQKGTTR